MEERTLRYRILPEDLEADYWLQNPQADRLHFREVLSGSILWWIMMGLGIATSVLADQLFFAILFAVFFLNSMRGALTARRDYRKALAAQFSRSEVHEIQLDVSDLGLQEVDRGIESFAPWDKVLNFRNEVGLIRIHLANRLQALVPKRELEEEEVRFLLETLKEKGVPESAPEFP